jgi:hypothetical protein
MHAYHHKMTKKIHLRFSFTLHLYDWFRVQRFWKIFRQSDPTKYLNTTNICRKWFRIVRHNEFYLFNYLLCCSYYMLLLFIKLSLSKINVIKLLTDMSPLSHAKYSYILRQYSVSKSYSLKLSVTKLYREYIPSCVMLLPFKVSTTSWLIIL